MDWPLILLIILFFIIFILLFVFILFRRLIPSFSSSPSGLTVLITGCDSGFGRHAALRLSRDGMIIFAGCLTRSGISSLEDELRKKDGKPQNGTPLQLHPFLLDVTDERSVQNAVDFVREKLPISKCLFGLINNAGISRLGPDPWLNAGPYEECWRVNTLGAIRMVHAFRTQLISAKGRIVNVSSVCGRLALPAFGPYSVSKFALRAYTDTIRRDLAPFGVHVSLVEPGFHRTPMTCPLRAQLHLARAWNEAPPEIRSAYGEGFVREQGIVARKLHESPLISSNTDAVVEAYRHALVAKFPRRCYQIGWDAHFCFVPLSRLSSTLQDWSLALLLRLIGAPRLQQSRSDLTILPLTL